MFRSRYHANAYRRSKIRWILPLLLVGMLVLAAGGAFLWFRSAITPLNATDTTLQVVTIETGSTEEVVGNLLQDRGLIRSSLAFQLYARVSGAKGQMQAGAYEINPSLSVHQIQEKLVKGDVATDLITILPAQRLDQIKLAFAEKGYKDDEIESALDPAKYVGHPALIDLPANATLEGYLYPESFIFTPTTPLTTIVEASLDQLAAVLTDDLRKQLLTYNLDVHQAITLASIVEREVNNADDREKVAQVFLLRFQKGMQLGSDPTALYGALKAGIEPSVFADTPYNTRLYEGLPPGPINNVSAESLRALANPADSDYVYFVSGDDGITYFSRTLEEHEALTAQHCIELCRSY